MTALFVLTINDTRFQTIVRAACLTCARNKAAEGAGPEGPAVWRDPAKSTVELLRQDGKPGVILRGQAQ